MSEMLTFEDLDIAADNKPEKPLWMFDVDDPKAEKDVLSWCNGELQSLKKAESLRLSKVRRNMMLYKGIQYLQQEVRDADQERVRRKYRQVKKIVINHLFDLVQQRISRLIEYKPAVTWSPTNDEYSDKISAQMMEMFCDHIWYLNQFEDEQVPDLVTWSKVMGESFLFTLWDPEMGPEHPDWKKAAKDGVKIPLLDENDEPVLDAKGKPRFIESPVYVGDVAYDPEVTFNVFHQRKMLWKNVDYLFRCKYMHVEEARIMFPKADPSIFKPCEQKQIYDYETMEFRETKNECEVNYLYYRPCKGMGKGRVLVFTKDGLAENVDYFEKTGLKKELPVERLLDFKNPMEPRGTSFIDHIKGPTSAYNNITNMILRNQYLVSHPKWMLPAGSADLQELGNDITVVQFRGPVAPALVQANPTPAELFNFRRELKTDSEQVGGVYSVSRGNPPPGIDAGIALQFLEEQEAKRANPDYLIFNSFVKRVALKTQKIAGAKYEPEDQRTIGVLGKYDRWMSVQLKLSDFEKDYDVRVANTSALPKSKTGRIQTLVYLQKNYPNAIPQEQVIDMMDLGQPSRFTDAATIAVRAAEMENDDMINGRKVQEPQEYENLIQHWKIHSRIPQDYGYHTYPGPIQEAFKQHIMTTESLMWEKGKKNPLFLQQLASLPNYPMFFTPDMPVPNQMPGEEGAMPTGDASTASDPIVPEPGVSVNPATPGETGGGPEEIVRPTRLVGQNAPPLE